MRWLTPRRDCWEKRLAETSKRWTWSRIARRIRVPLGFLFAAIYIWLARPAWWSIAAGAAISLFGVLIRALASGHVRKNEELTTTGPYGYTRNPLYLGSIVIAVGFAIAARSLWIGSVLVVLFLAIYLPVIRSEEEFLRGKFANFDDYVKRVPRLLPRLTSASPEPGSFSRELYLRHREYNALIGTVLMVSALIIKLVW
jgi:protein-S-isoprenylcysteine O-methyltransferase Ste14